MVAAGGHDSVGDRAALRAGAGSPAVTVRWVAPDVGLVCSLSMVSRNVTVRS